MIAESWEIGLIRQFQECEGLTTLMEVFTWLGYPQAYMIIIAVIYWTFDRKLGLRLAIFLPLAASVNSILKQAIHAPRPYWTNANIHAFHADSGFGMPSGHAQSATVWLLAAKYLKNRWFWTLSVILVFGVGISRAYLGVHFPSQILLGWLIGILLIILFIRFEEPVINWLKKLSLFYQLAFTLGCSVLIILLGSVFIAILNYWELPEEWIQIASANLELDHEGLKSYGLSSVTGNAGGFLGVAMGAILMHRIGIFQVKAVWWIRLLRVLIGLVCIASLFIGTQVFSPDKTHSLLHAGWRFLGFYLISFSAVFLLPLLFIKLKLLKMIS